MVWDSLCQIKPKRCLNYLVRYCKRLLFHCPPANFLALKRFEISAYYISINESHVKGVKQVFFRHELSNLTCMRYNIPKFRDFTVKRGKILNTYPLALKSDSESAIILDKIMISSIHSRPINWLGRIINGCLFDRQATYELSQ